MGRTVTAQVTYRGAGAGSVGPFEVDDPWWAEVEPVVAHVETSLGVPVVVLRLLGVEGADGARDGHVTYHVAALEPPRESGDGPVGDLGTADHPLRMPWAREAGVEALLAWAGEHVDVVGRFTQRKTWNLAGLFRLPTAECPVWVKALPPFAAAEPAALASLAEVDPHLVPRVLAAAPCRLLLAHMPGRDGWDATGPVVADTVRRLVTAQARLAGSDPGSHGDLPDRRPEVLAAAVSRLLDGPVGEELSREELRAARALLPRWEALAGCGLPNTLVHGDFHPGNWRHGEGPPVVLDLADAHLGNPVLDGLRAIGFLPPERRGDAARAWVGAWSAAVPGSRPDDALRIAAPLAHLAYAVRYQEFLDGIEPDERVYHLGDPAASIRHALETS